MADQDVLTLAGFAFTGFSPPDHMPFGGKQDMVVHKLPGGSRVIDTLGPDEADISWRGTFFGDDAYDNALYLDSLRAAGAQVNLSWGGQSRLVIIAEFHPYVVRLPNWVEYEITLTVASNPQLGVLTAIPSTIDALISSDLATAAAQ